MTGRANMTGRDPAHQGWFLAQLVTQDSVFNPALKRVLT